MNKKNLQRIYLKETTYEKYVEHLFQFEKNGLDVLKHEWNNTYAGKGEYFILFYPKITLGSNTMEENNKVAMTNLFNSQYKTDEEELSYVDVKTEDLSVSEEEIPFTMVKPR